MQAIMKIALFRQLTRIEFVFFGLPFLLTGALLPFASEANLSVSPFTWLWIVAAFMSARTSGMAFNALIDRAIDARNPRTENRPLPSGRVTPREVALVAWISLALFFLIALQISFLCFLLAPVVAFLIVIYSYMKRVHASCHFVLGMLHLLVPWMAAAALTGRLMLAPFLIGLGALFSITGNDIIYALHDYAIDCKEGLYSIPSRLGQKRAMAIARFLHLLSILSFVSAGLVAHLPLFFLGGPLAAACAFIRFHRRYPPQEGPFSSTNVIVGASIFLFFGAAILWRVM